MGKLYCRMAIGLPSAAAANATSEPILLGPENPSDADAELLGTVPSDETIVLGSFQRESELVLSEEERGLPRVRRATGGAPVRVGPGTIWLQLRLRRASALVPCNPPRVLNRYVRPLLRALTRSGAAASYFDRDWIAVAHRPAGLVSFAHDVASGEVLIEAFVAVSTPFALGDRASFRGREPGTLESIADRSDAMSILSAIHEAYREGHESSSGGERQAGSVRLHGLRRVESDPPWTATRDEALGLVAAGPDASGRMRIGGELVASRDAVASLEARVAALATAGSLSSDALGAAIDATLGAPPAVVFGLRSLKSIRDVIEEALRAQ